MTDANARTDDALVNATLEHAAWIIDQLMKGIPGDGEQSAITPRMFGEQCKAAIRADKTPEG